MTPERWIELIVGVVVAGLGLWRHFAAVRAALEAKDLGKALGAAIDGVEDLERDLPETAEVVKKRIKTAANALGALERLHREVKSRTEPPAAAPARRNGGAAAGALLALVLVGLGAAACATPTAGQSEAPAWGQGIQVPIVQVWIGEQAQLPTGLPGLSILITNAGSGTTSPASTANQTASTSTSPSLSVPAGAGVGLPVKLGGGGPVKPPEVPAPPAPPEPPPAPAPVEPPR